MTTSDDGVMTPNEAAEYLRRSNSWLAKARMAGDGPRFLRFGKMPAGRIGYLKADLDAWLATLRRRSTSDPGPAQ